MSGDTRVFAVINTTDYNGDHRWSVNPVGIDDLAGLGFDAEDIKQIDGMKVGGRLDGFGYYGLIVIRVA